MLIMRPRMVIQIRNLPRVRRRLSDAASCNIATGRIELKGMKIMIAIVDVITSSCLLNDTRDAHSIAAANTREASRKETVQCCTADILFVTDETLSQRVGTLLRRTATSTGI